MKRTNLFFTLFSISLVVCDTQPNGSSVDLRQNERNWPHWNCSESSDCKTPKTLCWVKKCECEWGLVFNAAMTACIPVATEYGERCNETTQCSAYLSAGGTCTNGTCTCAPGYHYFHSRCYKSADLGDECLEDNDCHSNAEIKALSCTKGKCVCSDGYYQREYRTCRRKAKAIGDECFIDQDCTFDQNALCNQNKCEKKSNKRMNDVDKNGDVSTNYSEPRFLYADPDIKNKCTNHDDCSHLGFALCSAGGFCYCHERGYSFNEKKDKCVCDLGESCPLSDIKNSIYRDNRLVCKTTHVPSTDLRTCRKATKKIKWSCQYHEQCYIFGPDAICLDEKCVCNKKSHYVEEENFCWINKGIDEDCKVHTDCYQSGLRSKLICNNNEKCSCPEGTHVNSAKTACIDNNPSLGASCSADVDCRPLVNVRCSNETCICAEHYFEQSGRCIAGIGGNCGTNDDCRVNNSSCETKSCRCSGSLVSPSPNLCINVADFGGECQYDVQCSSNVMNALCLKSEAAEPNESTIINPTSYRGVCGCEKGHHQSYRKCYKSKVLGEKCKSRGECYVSSDPDTVKCLKGVCTCDFDTKQINSTFCKNGGTKNYVFASWTILVAFLVKNAIA